VATHPLKTWFSGRNTSRRPRGSPRPSVELLESRVVLSAFAARAGGSLMDSGQGVAADAAGNVYVAGNLGGTQSDIDTNAYVAKYLASGVLQWSHQFGGPYVDSANAVAADRAGNAYVAGDFRGQVDFGNGIVLTSTGAIDGFVEKLDTNGNVRWAHQFASDGNFGPYLYDRLGTRAPKGIAVDQTGSVVVTGFFHGHIDMDFLAHPGQHFLDSSNAPNDNASGYVVKLDRDGNFVWEAQADGESGVSAFSVAVDAHNNVYTIGGFGNRAWFNDKSANNNDQPNANSLPMYDDSNRDVLYVWKLTANGLNARVTQLEKSPDSLGIFGLGIAVDAVGNVYATGAFAGAGFDFDIGVSQPDDTIDSLGSHDVFVEKLDSGGHFQWVRRAGDVGDDWGTGIALDRAGNPFVTGYITADALFGDILLTHVSPDGNSFITELDPTGNFLCAHKAADLAAAAPAGDKAAAIAVDGEGFVDITGAFSSRMQWPGLPPITSAGDSDIFVNKTKLECSPTHINLIDKHILQILGDNQVNRIEITDDRHWGILVALDDDAPRVFSGIDQVVVDALGGDDVVTFYCPDDNTLPPSVAVDLGGGDDAFALRASFGDNFDPNDVNIKLTAGGGNDSVHINVSGSVAVQMTANLGTGHDTSIYEFHDVEEMPAPEELNVIGGQGDKNISIIYGFTPGPGSPGDPPSAAITVNVEGGTGVNDIKVIYGFNPQPEPPGSPAGVFNIPLRTSIHGGGRGDEISVSYDFTPTLNSQLEPTLIPGIIVAAPIVLSVSGDGGADHLLASIAHDPPSNLAGGGPKFVATAPISVDIHGDGGDDSLIFDGRDLELSNALFTVNMSGNAGNDAIDVLARNLVFAADPAIDNPDLLNLVVDGGAGADQLSVRLEHLTFIGDPDLSIAVTGGDGSDVIIVDSVNPEGFSYGANRPILSIAADGGAGSDEIQVLGGETGAAATDADVALNWDVSVNGGLNNDDIRVVFGAIGPEDQPISPMLLNGDLRLRVDGGDGGDAVSAELIFDRRSQGMVDARVSGGAGNDLLSLLIYGMSDPYGTIDGGTGNDTAHATPGVRKINCEH
jgi:Beta-propeller repeat